ncbi:MAG: heparan-alpha-glucosaminide N-acetyltransferase domain-containing protein [Opitutus sp.]
MNSSPPAAAPSPAGPSARLASLDALRGFDMFWILGADELIHALAAWWDIRPLRFLAEQLDHKAWAGFAFYDLIFPLFIFIVGVSSVYSLSRLIEHKGRGEAVKRVLIRGLFLFLLGIFYNGGLMNRWPDVRLLGVLQRIALAYTAAGLLFCFLKPRALAATGIALLAGYWALMTFVPVRDIALDRTGMATRFGTANPPLAQVREAYDATTARVTGAFDPGRNLANHLDFEHLPGRKYDLYWDPEGYLSMLPAVTTCLLGIFAGLLLRRTDIDDRAKLTRLLVAGVAARALGWLWHLQFPVVKKIWTSSFVLVAGGWSFLLLGAFYYIIDMRRKRDWAQPFIWIGMNAITLYLISSIVSPRRVAQRIAGGDVQAWFDRVFATGAGGVLVTLVALLLMLALARFMHRRQIFLRL